MKSWVWLLVIVSSVVSVVPISAQSETAYALPGPYHVGTRPFVIEAGSRRLEGTVWYPALSSGTGEETATYAVGIQDIAPEMDTFVGHASLEAKPDGTHAPYPLVIFSHGNRASRFVTLYLFEHLASYGFVVMAVDHTGTAIRDSLTLTQAEYQAQALAAHVERPADIRRQIDEAEKLNAPAAPLAGMIDLERIGVGGWSLGGYTALAAAGASWDFAGLGEWCGEQTAQLLPGDSMTCALLEQQSKLTALLEAAETTADLSTALADPRITAVFAFAPGRIPLLGPQGLANVTVPALLFTGSADTIDPPESNTYAAYDQIGSAQKALVTLEGADHAVFTACSGKWGKLGLCSDPAWDLEQAQQVINHLTTAFLLATLSSDSTAAAALKPAAVTIEGVKYQAAGF